MEKNNIVHVRFPNETFYDEVTNFDLNDFKLEKEFAGEIFGWWQDTYVAVMREDFDKLTANKKY